MTRQAMQLTLVQHHEAEGPGEIANWAAAHDLALQVFRADLQQLPAVGNAPLILLGGPCSAHAGLDWLLRERAWLQACLNLGAPVFAICLGAQLMTLATGGKVEPMAQPELGWTEIRFADGTTLDVLEWHEDHCLPAPGVPVLAGSALCQQQMMRFGPQRLGLQFHPEWHAGSVQELNRFFGAQSPLPQEPDPQRFARVAAWLHTQLDAWWQASSTA